MKYPYLLTSDQHCHSWSQFSKTGADGVNSRLRSTLDEMTRAYLELEKAGGTDGFMGGDLFHVRGKIEPSVFNPTFDCLEAIHKRNEQIKTFAIPGNHDLEGNDADRLGNSMQALSSIDGFHVAVTPMRFGDVVIIPWHKDLYHLRALLQEQADAAQTEGKLASTDLIIHAPVNGVIKGIPDHGLEAEELAAYGFRRVFSGHYHDHKVFCDGKVVSIGATTHQTWSDPDTVAGFLLVYEDRIEHFPTQAPLFVDLNATLSDPNDDPLVYAKGNFVRVRLDDATDAEIRQWRDQLLGGGCLGANITTTKKAATITRTGAGQKSGTRLEESVTHYIRNDMKPTLLDEVEREALDVLTEARS